MASNVFAVGGCNCCKGTVCGLSGKDYKLRYANGCDTIDPIALRYQGGCRWLSDCWTVPASGCTFGGDLAFAMGIRPACSYFVSFGPVAPCPNNTLFLAGRSIQIPAGCASLTGGSAFTITSAVCSPLSIVLDGGGFTWTVYE